MTWQDLLDALNRIPEDQRDNPARFVHTNVFDEEKGSDDYMTDKEKNQYADQQGEEIDNMSVFPSDVEEGVMVYVLTP